MGGEQFMTGGPMLFKGSCHCVMAMVNVRCLEGVDFYALPVKHFDGRAL